jgi:hypothetical protein
MHVPDENVIDGYLGATPLNFFIFSKVELCPDVARPPVSLLTLAASSPYIADLVLAILLGSPIVLKSTSIQS